jgi:hypothetical protein
MLALLYFPDEHKWAVYMPLFGPMRKCWRRSPSIASSRVLIECRRWASAVVPLLVALVREVKEYRNRGKLAAAEKPKVE